MHGSESYCSAHAGLLRGGLERDVVRVVGTARLAVVFARAVRSHDCAVHWVHAAVVQGIVDDPVAVVTVGLTVAVPAAVGELSGGLSAGPFVNAVPVGVGALALAGVGVPTLRIRVHAHVAAAHAAVDCVENLDRVNLKGGANIHLRLGLLRRIRRRQARIWDTDLPSKYLARRAKAGQVFFAGLLVATHCFQNHTHPDDGHYGEGVRVSRVLGGGQRHHERHKGRFWSCKSHVTHAV